MADVGRLMRWPRRPRPRYVWLLEDLTRISVWASPEKARRYAESRIEYCWSPASFIRGQFEWRETKPGCERLFVPHPTEPQPRDSEYTLTRLKVNE